MFPGQNTRLGSILKLTFYFEEKSLDALSEVHRETTYQKWWAKVTVDFLQFT